jgi:hypothetical protein
MSARLMRRLRRQIVVGRHRTRIGLWLLADTLRFSRWHSLRIVLTELAGIAVRYGSLGLLYVFIHALQRMEPVHLPLMGGIELPVREFFTIGVLAGVLLMSLGNVLQFRVRLDAVQMAEHYERFCGRRVLALASRLPSPKASWATRMAGRESVNLFFAYSRTCGFVTRQIILLLPSFAGLLVGCIILLVLDAPTTLLLALFAALVILAQYPLNNVSAQASSRARHRRRDAMRAVNRLLVRQRTASLPLHENSAILRHLFAKRSEVRRDISLHGDRLRGGEGAVLVSRIGFNLLLGAAMLMIGSGIIAGERSWAEVAVYVAVTRFVLKDFGSIGKFMTGLSRQFGPVEHYIRFVVSAAMADAEPTPAEGPGGPVTLRARDLGGHEDRLVLEPGTVAAVVSRDRNLMPALLLLTHGEPPGQEPGPVFWVDGDLLLEDVPVTANLAMPAGMAAAELEAMAARLAPPDDPVPYRAGWTTRPVSQLPTPPPEWLICALKLAVAERRGAACVAIDAPTFLSLPETWRAAWPGIFTRGPMLVLYRDMLNVGPSGEATALLVEDGRIQVGTRLDPRTRRLLAIRWRRMVERMRVGASRIDDDDDEELADV